MTTIISQNKLLLPVTPRFSRYYIIDALEQLIYNSINTRTDEGVEIDISITDDEIIVSDNGNGMDLEGLKKVLTLGHPEKQGKLGKYGLWASCFAMGDSFEIVTKKKGDEYEYRVIFNSKELATRKEWTLPYEKKKTNVNEHYTCIMIDNLRNKNPLREVDDIIYNLQKRLSVFLENEKENIVININGNKLKAIAIEILYEHIVIFDEKKEAYTNYGIITGWASLMIKGPGDGNYGIHCYCNNKLIRPFSKIGFKEHPLYAHIFGRVNLDFVPIYDNKKDFITDSPEYREAETAMAILLKPLLKKSARFNYVLQQNIVD